MEGRTRQSGRQRRRGLACPNSAEAQSYTRQVYARPPVTCLLHSISELAVPYRPGIGPSHAAYADFSVSSISGNSADITLACGISSVERDQAFGWLLCASFRLRSSPRVIRSVP
jgi:hypothetical protein